MSCPASSRPDRFCSQTKYHLKIEVQRRSLEIRKLKKLVLDLERKLERLQHGSTREQHHDLGTRLRDSDRDLVAQCEQDIETQLEDCKQGTGTCC
ncbi:hypothetical protein AZE42_00670 [Rhizopogon vesiculosus]|uniref:Uncharacterized protein n=1 Tax=Rhizopogon vesiculosus TaxID=180088 RepID=A0A1J8QBQ0_9AGAM|nr:hypothetical protein AZE42_00670 [Rhizopogon vesiculosus]